MNHDYRYLQKIAKRYNLKANGTKKNLLKRIKNYETQHKTKVLKGGQKKTNYFLKNTKLNQREQTYCRCIYHVAAQQPDWCLTEQAYDKKKAELQKIAKKYRIDHTGLKQDILDRILAYQRKNKLNILGKRKRTIAKGKKQCYNPYSICSKSTRRKGRIECFKNTNLKNLPKNELIALAKLKGKSLKELRN